MATLNPFDLLGDNDNDDPSQLIEIVSAKLQKVALKKIPPQTPQPLNQKPANLPSKPLPPSQAVREGKNESGRGGIRGGGRGGGYGRGGGGGYHREYNNDNTLSNARPGGQGEEGGGGNLVERLPFGWPPGPHRGGRQGDFNSHEGGERPRRTFERRYDTGRGNETNREGFGRGNWGNTQPEKVSPAAEEVGEGNEKKSNAENVPVGADAVDARKEGQLNEAEEKEPEEKEMTLEEYSSVLEEKRKALVALKAEERKVEVDKELASMQPLSNKKDDQSVFIKLGSDKDKKKEASSEKEKPKKSVSINEFLKPAEGEKKYYSVGGRGRRGGPPRDIGGGPRFQNSGPNVVAAPKIEDPGHFPTLGATSK